MSQDTSSSRRPLPSRDELRIWRDYIETSEVLRRVMGARMQSRSSISSGDYAVLLALSEAKDRAMRSSDLAEHIGWDRSRLSHHLGRMEKRSLIRRERCPEDSRGCLVAVTDDGLQQFRCSSVPHLRDVRQLFVEPLTPQQLAAIGEAMIALRAHLEAAPDPSPRDH
ncbi:MarR family winged helix-turn-helix transcriptional regulator [Tessaracoccus caeni]|uniref:MarR family winged helix-turn-helix transcriptional regulator n=1 Tax=Tessaracoccus caeni TaxID=3031239 RepID=UPI0023DC2EEE|nr:MarR family winged helix-turn-helix transcriptional regulator [Tessaracoccus caeni]MDF1488382.1 MarR family winged helix-turn-helix transcriptional regulator [Tessaracoccus caeni]